HCWRCPIVTDEANLAAETATDRSPCATAGSSSSAKRVPGLHCWTSQQWRPALFLNVLFLAAGAAWLWSFPASHKNVERLTLSSPGAFSITTDLVIGLCLVGAA